MITLESLGWNAHFNSEFREYADSGFIPARISVEHKERYHVLSEFGELRAEVSGRLMYSASGPADFPKTGDWIAGNYFQEENKVIIQAILPRKTKFSRNAAGKRNEEQVLASNIDYLFIVQSMDDDFSLRRLERYLSSSLQGGIRPVIVLSKSDLCDEPEKILSKAHKAAEGIPIISTSSYTLSGINQVNEFIGPGITIAFAGSSGTGKSTLVNLLLGNEIQKTTEVREKDSKGRHTTTSREMFILPSGGIVLDTPGMREFQLWSVDDGVSMAFDEIESFASECKFTDCRHTKEKGCAVLAALESGIISDERYKSYLKLRKELEYLERKNDINAILEEKRKWKIIHKEQKRFFKNK